MKWLNDLKIAIIEKDVEKIYEIIKIQPDFKDLDKAKEALSLISEALKIANEQKDEILKTMQKIRQTKSFLNH